MKLISTSKTPVFLGLIKQGKLSEYRELILIFPSKGVSSSSIHRFQEFTGILKTNNEKVEKEIQETIPFTIATKRIKYLGIYLPKETKDLYTENYKTLMKEIKEDTNRWRNIP